MTNITAEHRAAFDALTSGNYSNFALFSCFVGGEPAAAIVAINRDGGGYTIHNRHPSKNLHCLGVNGIEACAT